MVSNQYLFTDPDEFAYIANNYISLTIAQLITASAGSSYRWDKTLVSVDGIYGSGLPGGFANLDRAALHAIELRRLPGLRPMAKRIRPSAKPLNLRFSVVNLLDTLYFS